MDWENHRLVREAKVVGGIGSDKIPRSGDQLKRIFIMCEIKPIRVWIKGSYVPLNSIDDQNIVQVKENIYRLDLFEKDEDLPLFIPALCFEEMSLILEFPSKDEKLIIGYTFRLMNGEEKRSICEPFTVNVKHAGKDNYLIYGGGLVALGKTDTSAYPCPNPYYGNPDPDRFNIPFMTEESLKRQYQTYDEIFS